MTKVKKYWQVFIISLLSEIEYRMNFFLNISFSLIPLASNILIWVAILKHKPNFMSYDLKDIIFYYVVIYIVENLTSIYMMDEVQNDINSGRLSNYLLKPMNYTIYKMVGFASKPFLFLIFVSIPAVVLSLIFYRLFYLKLTVVNFFCFVGSLIIGYILNYYLNFIISSLAFFFSQVNSLFSAFNILKNLITGKVFPLDLMPRVVYNFISFSPFPFLGYYPTAILSNRMPISEIYLFISIGIIWILVLAFIKNFMWQTGLRKYSAYGG
jgi:ABC-2 type transport system permease protein